MCEMRENCFIIAVTIYRKKELNIFSVINIAEMGNKVAGNFQNRCFTLTSLTSYLLFYVNLKTIKTNKQKNHT